MITDPTTITVNSFQMIRHELGSRAADFSPAELSIVERVIHSTADFEFVDRLAWSDDAIQAGVEALRAGFTINVFICNEGVQLPAKFAQTALADAHSHHRDIANHVCARA